MIFSYSPCYNTQRESVPLGIFSDLKNICSGTVQIIYSSPAKSIFRPEPVFLPYPTLLSQAVKI